MKWDNSPWRPVPADHDAVVIVRSCQVRQG
jgi:hypothetical protein